MRPEKILVGERGSSAVEFVLVGTLLTLLTLAVLQLALVVYVRNVVHDAAVEGAYYAALADTGMQEGTERAEHAIDRAIGEAYSEDMTIARFGTPGHGTVVLRIRTTLPLIGLLGVPQALEVEGRAPEESFDDE